MNRKNFGKLITALRKENFDSSTGKVWSQETLAERANLSLRTIQRIEQGELATIDEKTLLPLMLALQLTTLERRELCFAATGIIDADTAYPDNPLEAFREAWAVLQSICIPAILHDQFYDIMGVNSLALAMHDVSKEMLLVDKEESKGVNFLKYIFAPQSPLRSSLKNQWSYFVQRTILQFRHMSLRYRHTDSYQVLFNELNQYKEFRSAWTATQGTEETIYTQMRSYEYDHPVFGQIRYVVTNTTIITQLGNLYLSKVIPCSSRTQEVINQLVEIGKPYALSLTPWPNSKTIHESLERRVQL